MDDGYDFRKDNVAEPRAEEPAPVGKRTNNAFSLADLGSDEEMMDDEERAEAAEAARLAAEAERAEEDAAALDVSPDDAALSDDESLIAAAAAEGDEYGYKEVRERLRSLYEDYEAEAVPDIPEEYRGSGVIGLRTRATGNTSLEIGQIAPKKKLRAIWQGMTDVERYILMLVSEHRHLTPDQLETLVVLPSRVRQLPGGGHNSLKPYFEWVTCEMYAPTQKLSYKETFKTTTSRGLMDKIEHLVALTLIEAIVPSYRVNGCSDPRFRETPSLFTTHYYLTPLGARVLIQNTRATRPSSKAAGPHVGFVPTYRSAAYQSIVHETESAEIFISMIRNAVFVSNIDLLGAREEGDETDYGFVDVCRFVHEKDTERKYVPYEDRDAGVRRTTPFKPDGRLTIYSSRLGEFLDLFLEYDSGSTTPQKVRYKVDAFIKYVEWRTAVDGVRARRPVLLLVSQSPSNYMPHIRSDRPTRYTRGIQMVAERGMHETAPEDLDDVALVLVADARAIRMRGGLGPVWHRERLLDGVPERTARDLISSCVPATLGR